MRQNQIKYDETAGKTIVDVFTSRMKAILFVFVKRLVEQFSDQNFQFGVSRLTIAFF